MRGRRRQSPASAAAAGARGLESGRQRSAEADLHAQDRKLQELRLQLQDLSKWPRPCRHAPRRQLSKIPLVDCVVSPPILGWTTATVQDATVELASSLTHAACASPTGQHDHLQQEMRALQVCTPALVCLSWAS